MFFEKLTDAQNHTEYLGSGSVLRVPGTIPYEKIVDFMVFDPQKREYGMGLIVSSGHKGGLIRQLLPNNSKNGHSGAIHLPWLIQNWKEWIYPECNIEDAYVCLNGYPTPIELPR